MTHKLLLHGALGSGRQMAPLGALLGHDLPCPDLIGHGSLAHLDAPMTMEKMVAQVAAIIKHPTDIIGYSMGGYIALIVAAKHPEKVRRVVTIGTKFDWNIESAAKEARMLDPEKIREKVPAFAKYLESLHGANWTAAVSRTAEMMTALGLSPTLDTACLRTVSCPVMLLRGAADNMVTQEETLWAKDLLPIARIISLEGQPHQIEKTDMIIISEQIKNFLNAPHII